MVNRYIENHFLGAILLLAVMGLIFGIFATYLIGFIVAIHAIMDSIFGAMNGGIGGG